MESEDKMTLKSRTHLLNNVGMLQCLDQVITKTEFLNGLCIPSIAIRHRI